MCVYSQHRKRLGNLENAAPPSLIVMLCARMKETWMERDLIAR